MSTRWRRLAPLGLEIVHTHPPSVRAFGVLLLLAGSLMLIGIVGGLLREAPGSEAGPGWLEVLGMFAFALGFFCTGAWALGWRGIRRLDVAADTFHEAGSVFGIRWATRRRLSDCKRLILVRKPPITGLNTRTAYDLYLFASRTDWTALMTTYAESEARELGLAVGTLLKRSVETMDREDWDRLAV